MNIELNSIEIPVSFYHAATFYIQLTLPQDDEEFIHVSPLWYRHNLGRVKVFGHFRKLPIKLS